MTSVNQRDDVGLLLLEIIIIFYKRKFFFFVSIESWPMHIQKTYLNHITFRLIFI